MLNSKQTAYLKALSHSKNAVVQIGLKGLTDSVTKEIDANLNAHELIKIKVQSDSKENRSDMLTSICEKLRAEPVNHIGKLLVIFRPNPKKTKITLP